MYKKNPKNLIFLLWLFMALANLSSCLINPFNSSSSSIPLTTEKETETETETTTTPADNTPVVNTRKMKNLGIFYGWPTGINGVDSINWTNRVSLAADELAKYDRIVLGATLEEVTHGDHENTKTIISTIKSGVTGTQVYGYVCVGTCGGDYPSASTINAKVDKWNVMNIDGIFFDESGFDFGDNAETDLQTRARMVNIVTHAHSLGLKVMINAWNPDDIFTKVSSNPVPLISGDSFLLESYLYSEDTPSGILLTSSGSFSDFLDRVNKATNFKPSGVEIWGVSTTGESTSAFNQDHWSNLVSMAWGHNLTGIGWGTKSFSSSDSIMPFRAIPNNLLNLQFNSSTPGSSSLSVSVTNQNGTVENLSPQFSLTP